MNKKEKIISTSILLLYVLMLIAGYALNVLDWETIKANYLIAPCLAAVTIGLGKKWFGYSMLTCAVVGLLIYYILLLAGVSAPGAIINIAFLAVGVIIGIILDLKAKEA